MNKLMLIAFAGLMSFGLAQDYVGAWAIETSVDAFTDVQSATLLTGENGAYPADSEAVLGLICTGGALQSLLVQFNSQLDTEVAKDFDYRLDGGPVLTGEAWVDGRGMGVSPEVDEETFEAMQGALLSDAERLAIRVEDRTGEARTAIFLLENLGEALASAECAMGEGARATP